MSALFDGARFDLPRRPAFPVAGIGLVLLGLFITVFMTFWIWGPLSGAFRMRSGFRWGWLFFGWMGLPILAMGLGMIVAGVAVAWGKTRSTIETTRGRLRLTEHFGPLRWTWTRPLEGIRRFRLEEAGPEGKEIPAALTSRGIAGPFLVVESGKEKPLHIALFYPPEIIRPLADALADVTNRARAPAAIGARPPAVVVAAGNSAEIEPYEGPPPKTEVTIREFGEGFAMDIPPVGLVKGSKGLFVFNVIWLMFCSLLFILPLRAAKTAPEMIPFLLFAFLFICIGLVLLGISIHLGRRRVMIAVNAHSLGIRQIGPFGTKEQRYPRAEIVAVRVGDSGIQINSRPVMELQIHLKGEGRKIGCLSSLTEDELRWLAAELRRRLGVPAR